MRVDLLELIIGLPTAQIRHNHIEDYHINSVLVLSIELNSFLAASSLSDLPHHTS